MNMIYLRKPKPDKLQAFLAEQAGLDFSYDAVGATATVPPAGFTVDRSRVEIGLGEGAFRTAQAVLLHWQQFKLGWVDAWSNEADLRVGQNVAILGRGAGLWWLNACRVVYTIDEVVSVPPSQSKLTQTVAAPPEPSGAATLWHRFGFANGTLPGHIARGEERFLIEWDRTTDQVWYDILAFSRPSRLVSRLGYPWIRLSQSRFRQQSTTAMLQAVRQACRESVGSIPDRLARVATPSTDPQTPRSV